MARNSGRATLQQTPLSHKPPNPDSLAGPDTVAATPTIRPPEDSPDMHRATHRKTKIPSNGYNNLIFHK